MTKKLFSIALVIVILSCCLPESMMAAPILRRSAIDCIEGGEGIGFHDTSEKHALEGTVISVVMRQSEWQIYEFYTEEEGNYNVVVEAAKPIGGYLKVYSSVVDGGDETEQYGLVGNTGSNTRYCDFNIGKYYLESGKHQVKVRLSIDHLYVRAVRIEKDTGKGAEKETAQKAAGAYKEYYIPTIIEAEDYDNDDGSYYSFFGANIGMMYRPDDEMTIYETEAKSGKYYIRLTSSEYATYTFNCECNGIYDVYVKYINDNADIKLYYDDYGYINTSNTNRGGDSFAGSLYIEEGKHKFKIEVETGNADIDYIVVRNSEKSEYLTAADFKFEEDNDFERITYNNIYKTIYVSPDGSDENDGSESAPFKSVEKVRDELKEITAHMTGDIVVDFKPGYYFVDGYVNFGTDCGGKNGYNVILRGEDGAAIGGGKKVEGWQSLGNGIYRAPFACDTDTRCLYVNDYPAARARSKYLYTGTYINDEIKEKTDGLEFELKNFPKLYAPQRTELVTTIEWSTRRDAVKSYEYTPNSIKLWKYVRYSGKPESITCFIENDLGLLDEPGEFYYDYDNQMMYYYPFAEENLETADVYAGVSEGLLKIWGEDKDSKIENVIIENLDFKYGAWLDVCYGIRFDQGQYLMDTNGDKWYGRLIPAQVEVTNAKNVTIKDCRFICLGSDAIGMKDAVTNGKIFGCVFRDLSSGAIILSSDKHMNKVADGSERCRNIYIGNNVIRRVATEYRGSCAIFTMFPVSPRIIHNDIKDIPYTGIEMSWGYGIITAAENNNYIVANNKIENAMQVNRDGAHIYALGPIINSKIYGNYLIKTGDYRGGIYCDEGSGHIEIYDNVVDTTGNWLYARGNVRLQNIYAHDNFASSATQTVDEFNVKEENNTIVPDKNWNEKAQSIIKNAGLESKYQHLLNEVECVDYKTGYYQNLPKAKFTPRNGWISPLTYVNSYKPNGEPVLSAGENIGNTLAGEWYEYDVEFHETGLYHLTLRGGNGNAAATAMAKVYLDGKELKTVVVPYGLNWALSDIDFGDFLISKGVHKVKLEHVSSNWLVGPFKFRLLSDPEDSVENDPEYDDGIIKSNVVSEENNETVFVDLINHWSEDDIMNLYRKNLIAGVGENYFAPNEKLSLYDAIRLILRASGIPFDENNINSTAYDLGYLTDIHESNAAITREQYCNMLMSVYDRKLGGYTIKVEENPYADFDSIDSQFTMAVQGAKYLNIMVGNEKKQFCPKDELTRAEAGAALNRLLTYIGMDN